MSNFMGFPYPVKNNSQGFFYSQSGVDQIKSDLLILLLTNPGERCLTGDTEIYVTYGQKRPIKELLDKDFLTYVYDIETGFILLVKAKAFKTVENAELMEITLDNNEKVKCTPNHLWLLANGEYKQADELKSKNSLMPLDFNTKISVKEIKKLEYREDCYDLHVEKYHNFALGAGVFVHNCMNPTFGTPLRDLLFEPNNSISQIAVKNTIINSITKWEPRINIQQIDVSTTIDKNSINPADDQSESENLLFIRIIFIDPQNIKEVQELTLEVPISGS